MKIDDFLISIIDGSIFISLLFSIHLLCSYHPYHRIFPLIMGNISFLFLAIYINLFILKQAYLPANSNKNKNNVLLDAFFGV